MSNVYRDGKVHVMAAQCATCIFNPHARPVDGARVAGMVRATQSVDGGNVVCHHTLGACEDGQVRNAVCRGWYDRLADTHQAFQVAQRLGIIEEQKEGAW